MVRPPIFNKKRDFLSPSNVVESLDIKVGDVVIDFGSGSGFWSIPIAQKVGKSGRVYVTDPKIENLTVIKRRADQLGLRNLEYIQAPYDSTSIPLKVKADVILISNILSMIKNDDKLIESTAKNSHTETKLVVIDWDKNTEIGPKKEDRTEAGEVMVWAKKAGFVFKHLLDAGVHHFGLYFEYGGQK